MTPAERRAQLQAILDRHDDIARAFRRATTNIDATQDSLEAIGRTVRDTTHAMREALDGMLAANTAALALFNDETR
jgi:ABC-type transporter Mla subunit MlaD